MARLLDRPALPAFARFHMDGHWDPDGRQMVEAIARVLGDPAVPIRPLPGGSFAWPRCSPRRHAS